MSHARDAGERADAARRLTQARVAELFGIPQPHVSELKNYKLSRFSSERLLRFVTLLDRTSRSSSGRRPRGTRRASCPSRSLEDRTKRRPPLCLVLPAARHLVL